MPQLYHSNATTNKHIRAQIQQSTLSDTELQSKYRVNIKTIKKHRHRDFTEDKSSRPHNIKYSLSPLEKELIRVIRTLTWSSLDELVDTLSDTVPNSKRSNIYRTLVEFGINAVPKEEREKAKIFKEYRPGFLHIDVTYLPKLDGKRYYLFVAIDRATRFVYYKVYDNKTADNAVAFLKECKDFYPFYIEHILTDNGLEFTDRFARGNSKPSNNHKFDKECKKQDINHRLTAPATPKTNGMVERVNGTIKNSTIKVSDYKNIGELKIDLNKFLIYYNTCRRHGSLKKELSVRTPSDAVKKWFELEPTIFKVLPNEFYSIDLKENGITL